MTPMTYLKAARLKLAYDELSSADPSATTVTKIALGCGFPHMGKFAKDFKDHYGISPFQLLRAPH
jgi:transcriptional regulator GlxA family with amidase domain